MLAASRDYRLETPWGRMRADQLAAATPGTAWQRISAGQAAKGHRFYDWALVATTSPTHQLLIRRYRAWYRHVTLAMLAAAYLAVTASTTTPQTHTAAPTSAQEPEKGVPQVVDDAAAPGPQSG